METPLHLTPPNDKGDVQRFTLVEEDGHAMVRVETIVPNVSSPGFETSPNLRWIFFVLGRKRKGWKRLGGCFERARRCPTNLEASEFLPP
jgi:hypothetical protein